MNKEITISYLGKEFKTKHYYSLTDKECISIRDNFFNKPPFGEVISEIKKLYFSNGTQISKIYAYYFFELMSDCRLKGCKWTIKEFINCDELLCFAVGKIKNNSQFFDLKKDYIYNIKTLFRLSPSGTAAKLSNFPFSEAKKIISKYSKNKNYYDFSCGWGTRLLAAFTNNINYFGTDPNTSLVDSLLNLTTHFQKYTSTKSKVDIRKHGSEIFVSEWSNMMGLAFSSPPYFDLEEYSTSNPIGQSIELYSNYSKWLSNYLLKTIENIQDYLIDDGFFLINIKNLDERNLLDDTKNIVLTKEFDYVESIKLKNITRVILSKNNRTADETILVFKRKIRKT